MVFSYFGIVGNPRNIYIDGYVLIILATSILFFLSIKSWTNAGLFLLLIPALIEYKSDFLVFKERVMRRQFFCVIFALAMPVIAILVSQAIQQSWVIKAFDSPSRIFLSIILFRYFIIKKIDVSRVIGVTAPLALLIVIPVIHMRPDILAHWGGRFATAAVDPTQFGTYTLVLAAFCLFSLEASTPSSSKLFMLQLTGLLAGLYLIAGSGTRGSWVAIPPLILMWFFLKNKMLHPRVVLVSGVAFFIGLLLVGFFHPSAFDRLVSGYEEFRSWIDNSNTETSTGFRLTMWQISWELFKSNPFYGYGDSGIASYLNNPWITSFTSAEVRQIILYNGTHNEFLANLVRSGVLGGVSVLCLFWIPFYLFWQYRYIERARQACHQGIAFIICLAFCSLSSEVLTLKYTASFYGIVIAGLAAQIFHIRREQPESDIEF